MTESVYLTKAGYEKLEKELKQLKGTKRRELADAIDKARQLGDLSENAEYESARHAQSLNEGRIMEIEDKLARCKIVDNEKISSDKAYIGAKLRLIDLDSKEEINYMLVTEDEASFPEGKVSISSPVGKALLGKKKDEIININVPAGVLKYKIVDISR
ncbi:MAG: transcription elongation factor GreA [Candidatus Omnitrophota bacterium]